MRFSNSTDDERGDLASSSFLATSAMAALRVPTLAVIPGCLVVMPYVSLGVPHRRLLHIAILIPSKGNAVPPGGIGIGIRTGLAGDITRQMTMSHQELKDKYAS